MFATSAGFTNIVRMLLESGADTEATGDVTGWYGVKVSDICLYTCWQLP
jgi:hypothetical protein